jgi:hypothetical protein
MHVYSELCGAGASGQTGGKWTEGRDLWCKRCEVQYCLHCGEKTGTLVKWHANKTCQEFLQEVENAKACATRKMLEDEANAGCAPVSCLNFFPCFFTAVCRSPVYSAVSSFDHLRMAF